MRAIQIIIVFFFTPVIYAQTASTVLKEVNNTYLKGKSLSYSSVYNLYRNAAAKKPLQTYTGLYKKNEKNEIYQKIDQVEIITNQWFSLSINHPEKLMSLSKPLQYNDSQSFDIKGLLDICKILEFKTLSNAWQITLEPLPLSGLTFSKIVVWINKSYQITKQKYYYNTILDFSNSYHKTDTDYPVLEVIHKNHSKRVINATFFDLKKYYSAQGNNLSVKKLYNQYTLEDYR